MGFWLGLLIGIAVGYIAALLMILLIAYAKESEYGA